MQQRPSSLRCATALCLAIASASLALPTSAAEPTSTVLSGLNIPAGPLSQSLSAFAQASGITLSYSPQLVQGLRSNGLQGAISVEAALDSLLGGTGLTARRGNAGYVIVDATDDGSALLAPIDVEGVALNQTGVAPVAGYHASVSRTATKTDTPLLETAQGVSVVTAEQISDRKPVSIEEAVAYTAGVSVGAAGLDPRFDQVRIRGYAATTNADYLDGLRQANSGWLSYFSSEPFSLERIEILKGPA